MVYGTPGRGAGRRRAPVLGRVGALRRSRWTRSSSLEADVELVHSMCLEAVDHVVTTERFRDFAIPEYAWEGVAASWRRTTRTSTAGSTCATTAAARPSCWSTTPTPRPRCWRRRSCSGTGSRTSTPTTTSGTRCTRSSSSGGPRSAGGCPATTSLHLVVRRLHRRGPRHGRLPAGDRGRGGARHDRAGDRGRRLGRVAGPLRRPRRGLHVRGVQALPLGVGAHRRLRQARARSLPETLWLEPLWKSLLSNKALLAVLWEMYPGHPNLLPAYLDQPGLLTEYVRKPRLGPEGANIAIVSPGTETQTGGVYGEEGYVYQLFDPLPEFDGYRPALGAWIVGDTVRGPRHPRDRRPGDRRRRGLRAAPHPRRSNPRSWRTLMTLAARPGSSP